MKLISLCVLLMADFLPCHAADVGNSGVMAEMALLDLAGRLAGKPTIHLLGLSGKEPVPGVFCILSDDPAQVEKMAKLALKQQL